MEDNFIELFTEIVENDTQVRLDDVLLEIEGWDSLAALSLISMIDDEYGITVGSKELEEMVTVGDVLDFINGKRL